MNCLVKKKDVMEGALVLPLCYCESNKIGGVLGEVVGHSAGVYGWDCDYYEMRGEGVCLVVSEGYRPCSNATEAQREAWREIFEQVAKLYAKAESKAGDRWNISGKAREQLDRRYRKTLLRKWKAFLRSEFEKRKD